MLRRRRLNIKKALGRSQRLSLLSALTQSAPIRRASFPWDPFLTPRRNSFVWATVLRRRKTLVDEWSPSRGAPRQAGSLTTAGGAESMGTRLTQEPIPPLVVEHEHVGRVLAGEALRAGARGGLLADEVRVLERADAVPAPLLVDALQQHAPGALERVGRRVGGRHAPLRHAVVVPRVRARADRRPRRDAELVERGQPRRLAPRQTRRDAGQARGRPARVGRGARVYPRVGVGVGVGARGRGRG